MELTRHSEVAQEAAQRDTRSRHHHHLETENVAQKTKQNTVRKESQKQNQNTQIKRMKIKWENSHTLNKRHVTLEKMSHMQNKRWKYRSALKGRLAAAKLGRR